ncbi:MAG TPA: DUF4232 domain-containing protein [Solirubrobacteraceae bacterium]|nr:DUF4232 domain-containing protein [Solirubrobacteraceae bacterium]
MRPVFLTALVALAAAGLSACGSTNSSSVIPAHTATARTTTSVPALTTGTATTTAASTATGTATVTTQTITAPGDGGSGLTGTDASAAAACVAADVRAAAAPPNGATGTIVLGFTLTNTSTSTCRTYGFPGIGLISADGSVVDPHAQRTTQDALGTSPLRHFTIGPGGQASFRVAVHDFNAQGSETGCHRYPAVQIILPDDTATLRVTLPNGAVTVCGTPQVTPLQPGTLGTGQ